MQKDYCQTEEGKQNCIGCPAENGDGKPCPEMGMAFPVTEKVSVMCSGWWNMGWVDFVGKFEG